MSPVLRVLIIIGGVFLLIVAVLVVLAARIDPLGDEVKHRVHCMNNLYRIGTLLVAKQVGEGLRPLSGPAFLLQVVGELNDEDLDVFICPAEPEGAAPNRPPLNSAEFIRMYRDLKPSDLTRDLDWSRYTSYAGPNLKDFPIQSGSGGSRLWAGDACGGGHPHHDGIVVLYASPKVVFIKPENLKGMRGDEILVGPRSPDPRLEKMIYAPK